MDPEKFLILGEELVKRATPCDCRTAIGRAYYGVLQVTAAYIGGAGFSLPKQTEIHQKLWWDLLNCGLPELAPAGSELSALHGMRIKADYRMKDTDSEDHETAKYWVRLARDHFETIKDAFGVLKRQQTIDAIRAYRKKANRPL